MLPKLIALAASLFLMLVAFGWQSWQLWQIRSGQFIDNASLVLKVDTRQSQGPGLLQIADRHLFGNPADRPAPEPEKPAVLPVTDLKMVLVGAITDSDPAKASALIQTDKDTKRYFVGDDIRGQAVLNEVASDSVVLKRGNRLEKLEFPKAGDLSLEAKGAIANLLDSREKQSSKAVPVANQAASAPQAAPPAQQNQPATQDNKQDNKANVPGQKTGRSLRERLQNRPKTTQKPPAS